MTLPEKARLLLKRRADPPGVPFYWKQGWKQKLLLISGYLVIGLLSINIGMEIWGAVVLTFGAATTLRDYRWWSALSQEWPQTVELLDWDKIEKLAAEG